MPSNRQLESFPPELLLQHCAPPIAALAEQLRRIVADAVPDAIERVRPGWQLIGYDLPLRRRTAFFAWVWPEPEHVHLGFPRGADMDDADRWMKGAGVTKAARWLTYSPGDTIDAERATQLVLEAARVAVIPRSAR
jgi:hypothetical protein